MFSSTEYLRSNIKTFRNPSERIVGSVGGGGQWPGLPPLTKFLSSVNTIRPELANRKVVQLQGPIEELDIKISL